MVQRDQQTAAVSKMADIALERALGDGVKPLAVG
jgi:hypothetical protein